MPDTPASLTPPLFPALPETVAADLRHRFTYHPPQPGQPEVYQLLRSYGYQLALAIAEHCGQSREASLALTHIEQGVMWANAAIARHGLARVPAAPAPGPVAGVAGVAGASTPELRG